MVQAYILKNGQYVPNPRFEALSLPKPVKTGVSFKELKRELKRCGL